jgi:hypothetical protein
VTDSPQAIARRLISQRAHAVAERVRASVRPLFIEEDDAPQLVGSGVLIALGEATFLLSAAHVLDERNQGTWIFGPNGLLPLTGECLFSSIPSEGRDADKLDVGAVRLSDDLARALGELRILTAYDLDLDDRAFVDSPPSKQYLVVGYPASKAKPRRQTRRLTVETFVLTATALAREQYKRLEVDDFSHLALSFDQRKVTNVDGRVTAPHLYGVSGGGIWTLGRTIDAEGQDARLAAIGTEWHQGPTKAILGTRVALFTEMIRDHCPTLTASIPRPSGIHVRTLGPED